MHILLIHQSFASPGEPGGTRHYELAARLARAGQRVTVIASRTNYMTGGPSWGDGPATAVPRGASESAQPAGPLPSGGKGPGADGREAMAVLRVWAPRRGDHRFLERLWGFLAFVWTSFSAALRVRGVDLVWGTTPPLFQAATAYAVARLRRVPLVLEVRDLWPEFAVAAGVLRNRALIRAARWLERFLYMRAERIVVNSPGFIPHVTRQGVGRDAVDLVPNGVETSAFDPATKGEGVRRELQLGDKFVVLYAGAHGVANDLGTLLGAAKILESVRDIVFVLVGDGPQRPALRAQAAALGLTQVRFVPAQPKARMPEFLAAADVCVAILQPVRSFATTYPNKVFDYMAAGRPTVLAIDGPIREVVERADCGMFVPPGDASALAAAVLAYHREPARRRRHGENGRPHVCAHFDRGRQAAELLASFERARGGSRRPNQVRNGDVAGQWWWRRGPAMVMKRSLDAVVAAVALVVLLPLFLVIWTVVRVAMGAPVLFRQTRLGHAGRPFEILKFRTMLDLRDRTGEPLPDEVRMTGIGRFLRTTTLDELPELVNVLRGEMSLVGPRPLLDEYRGLYSAEQWRRHEMPPGMAGPVLASRRNLLSWEEKFAHDVWYVDHWSLWGDLKILARTALNVLSRKGVNAAGHATAPKFRPADGSTARGLGDREERRSTAREGGERAQATDRAAAGSPGKRSDGARPERTADARAVDS